MDYRCFIPGQSQNADAGAALDRIMQNEFPEEAFSQMIRYRLRGDAAAVCRDNYFIAMDGDKCASRLWYGWGLHPDAIGNFGHFRTQVEYQGLGIGRNLLHQLFEHLESVPVPPLALMCNSAEHLVKMYGKYGFRLAIDGTTWGPLYKPLGDSPETFREFYHNYYTPADELNFEVSGIEFRHEIDLLLRFALRNEKSQQEMPFASYEAAVVELYKNPAAGKLERIVIANGHTVGWAFTPAGGKRFIQIYPLYRDLI